MPESPKIVLKVRPFLGGMQVAQMSQLLPKGAYFRSAGGRFQIGGQGWFSLDVAADPFLVEEVKVLLALNNWQIAQEE